MEQLKRYVGKTVKVVFKDGSNITVASGLVLSVSDKFIEIKQTAHNDVLMINLSSIDKISMGLGENANMRRYGG